jgi:SAM-dependent methyltransferase
MHPLNENDNLFQRITFKVVRRFIDLWFGLFSSKARRLNNELFSDIRILTEQEWELFAGKIKAYSEAREYKPDYTNSWLNHGYRLYLSIKWIEDIIRENDIHDAMDLGEGTPFTDLLREYFPGITWSNSQGDLRYRWEMQDESMDLIICTELLEHLSDLPDGLNDSFRMTGLRAALKECHRVLKPEGWLFITTPNSVSMLNIERILLGNPAWFFPLHVREYEPNELLAEIRESGFTIHNWRTVHCLTAGEKKDYTWLYQIMLASGYPVRDRGDDIFVVARKS